MPTLPLTEEQKEDAARLRAAFASWQARMKEKGHRPSQIAVAAEIGLTQSGLNHYLQGRQPLNWLTLSKLCALMGVDPTTISIDIVRQEIERSSHFQYEKAHAEAPEKTYVAREPEFNSQYGKEPRVPAVFVSFSVGEKVPEQLWALNNIAVNREQAEVFSADPEAFACKVTEDNMAPRYMPGEYALVEPTIPPDLEDDVLVRFSSGVTALMRLLSRRGGITLGAYNSVTRNLFREDEISWMYYVAHAIPARRVEQVKVTNFLKIPNSLEQ